MTWTQILMEVEETNWMHSKFEIASSMIHRRIVLHIGRRDENVLLSEWKSFSFDKEVVVVSRMLERE